MIKIQKKNEVRDILEQIDNSRKEVVVLKREYVDMDADYHSRNAETSKMVIGQLEYLDGDFRKNLNSSKAELSFLRQQLNITKSERESLDNYVSKLENRVKNDEEIIGFKYLVPDHDD